MTEIRMKLIKMQLHNPKLRMENMDTCGFYINSRYRYLINKKYVLLNYIIIEKLNQSTACHG
jgi:hypothetical protein